MVSLVPAKETAGAIVTVSVALYATNAKDMSLFLDVPGGASLDATIVPIVQRIISFSNGQTLAAVP